jgi:hypothetical protein
VYIHQHGYCTERDTPVYIQQYGYCTERDTLVYTSIEKADQQQRSVADYLVWLAVRRQTTQIGGIWKKCFVVNTTAAWCCGGFNNVAFPHDLTSRPGFATDTDILFFYVCIVYTIRNDSNISYIFMNDIYYYAAIFRKVISFLGNLTGLKFAQCRGNSGRYGPN